MTTIRDVAARAGVSIGTVSNVLTDRRPVTPEMADRVREAMSDLEYLPNGIARSLRGQRTQTLGLVVPDNANPFFAETSWEIEQASAQAGFALILCNTGRSLEREAAAIALLLEKRVDGIIIASSEDQPVLSHGAADRVPLIMIDHDPTGLAVDAVLVDHARGGELAARHLVALGHQRIACITGLPARANATRIQGFRRVLTEAGQDLPAEMIRESDTHADSGYHVARALLAGNPGITAIFAANDLVALGAIRASHDLGRPVPEQLSVVGYDDITLASQVLPRLTTIRQPRAEIGRRVIEVLRHRIADRTSPVERWVLPVEFVERESTAPPRAE